jgi:hypothetical protein
MRRRTIGSETSGLEEGLAGQDVLVPLHSSDSMWRARRLQADSNTLVRLASGLTSSVSRSSAALQGCTLEEAWLSTFASPESVWEFQ